MKVITLRMPLALWQAVRSIAEQHHRSVTGEILAALEAWRETSDAAAA